MTGSLFWLVKMPELWGGAKSVIQRVFTKVICQWCAFDSGRPRRKTVRTEPITDDAQRYYTGVLHRRGCAYLTRKKGCKGDRLPCGTRGSWDKTLELYLCKEHKPARIDYKRRWQKGTLDLSIKRRKEMLAKDLLETQGGIEYLKGMCECLTRDAAELTSTLRAKEAHICRLADILSKGDEESTRRIVIRHMKRGKPSKGDYPSLGL